MHEASQRFLCCAIVPSLRYGNSQRMFFIFGATDARAHFGCVICNEDVDSVASGQCDVIEDTTSNCETDCVQTKRVSMGWTHQFSNPIFVEQQNGKASFESLLLCLAVHNLKNIV